MTDLPLKGIKVVDFTWVWTGPTTTKALSDFGARVLRLESRQRPDVWRISPPFKDDEPGPNRGAIFNTINTGKMSLTINLKHPKAMPIVKELIGWADVVADNFAGGAMARMGLGYEVIREIKPDIIMMSSALMGQTGPWHDSPGFGDQLSAISGLHEISGWPDRIPGEIGFYTDFIAPRFNALTLLAAIDYRRRTGKGQYLDMAQHQAGVQYIAPSLLDYVANGRIASRRGNHNDYAAPHNYYRCAGTDRWCAIAVHDDEEWQALRTTMGDPAWARDARFATIEARHEHHEELDALIETWTRERTDEEVMTILQQAGVPAGRLNTTEDQMEHDAQLEERRFYQPLEHPELGTYHPARQACILSKTPAETRRAPLIGEHNEYVLEEIVGLDADTIAEMTADGVFE